MPGIHQCEYQRRWLIYSLSRLIQYDHVETILSTDTYLLVLVRRRHQVGNFLRFFSRVVGNPPPPAPLPHRLRKKPLVERQWTESIVNPSARWRQQRIHSAHLMNALLRFFQCPLKDFFHGQNKFGCSTPPLGVRNWKVVDILYYTFWGFLSLFNVARMFFFQCPHSAKGGRRGVGVLVSCVAVVVWP